MKTQWLAVATAAALAAVPCLAQTDTGTGTTDNTMSTGTTTGTTSTSTSTDVNTGTTTVTGNMGATTGTVTGTGAGSVTGTGSAYGTTTGVTGSVGTGATMQGATGTVTGVNYTNVDVAAVRRDMDRLRGYIDRMRDNNRLANAAGDIVQADGFRRTNEVLLDNASGLAYNILNELGSPMDIPPGMGEARDHLDLVAMHLGHARMMSDYSVPIDQARDHLNDAYQALDRGAAAMAGTNMSGSTGAGMMGGMSGTMGMSGSMGTMGNMGTMDNRTANPNVNQSNPGLSNYNRMNNAGTGQGAVTSTPNTTPGQPGTDTANPSGTTGTTGTTDNTGTGTGTTGSGNPS